MTLDGCQTAHEWTPFELHSNEPFEFILQHVSMAWGERVHNSPRAGSQGSLHGWKQTAVTLYGLAFTIHPFEPFVFIFQ
jgi:hypothetical protein